jgi:Heparinase II/III-like protein/Heparinase II/III N-terminus
MFLFINKNRVMYILRRLIESPFKFLLHKIWILLCKKMIFLPNSPALIVLEKMTVRKLSNNSKSINDLVLRVGDFSISNSQQLTDLKSIIERGKYNCLGYGLVDLASENAFHTDCIHDFSWPQVHFSKIDFVCSNIRADVKIPWEKSRLQWLLLLTTHYASASMLDEKKSKILELFNGWLNSNRFLLGVNWCSSMEVAIRVINIVTIYRILAPYLNDTEVSIFLKSIAQHKIYLKLFPEISDIPGNHFLATEVGKYIVDSTIAYSNKYLSKRTVQLSDVVINQFDAGGMHIEYAPMYHRLCLDMVLLVILFGNDKHIAGENFAHMKLVLKKAIKALRTVSSAKGKIAIFGDNDSGQVFWFGEDARDASLYLNLKCGDLSSHNTLQAEFLSMLFPFSFSVFKDLVEDVKQARKPCNTAYPFHTLETDSFRLVTRIGKLGLGERGAHDHDDNLSFWLFDGEDDVIVEMGCAPYTLSIKEREKCISSSAHNIITPVGSERYSLVDGSIFKTVKGAETALLTETSESKIRAKIKFDKHEHERSFTCNQQSVVIKDVISSVTDLVCFHMYINSTELIDSNKVDRIEFASPTGKKYELRFVSGNIKSTEIESAAFYPSYGSSRKVKHIQSIVVPNSDHIELEISKVQH